MVQTRFGHGALLAMLGAERQLLVKARRIEFGLLGATSGLLAALGAELVSLGRAGVCTARHGANPLRPRRTAGQDRKSVV